MIIVRFLFLEIKYHLILNYIDLYYKIGLFEILIIQLIYFDFELNFSNHKTFNLVSFLNLNLKSHYLNLVDLSRFKRSFRLLSNKILSNEILFNKKRLENNCIQHPDFNP